MPKFMVLVRGTTATETAQPITDELAEMGRYNASLVDAGILVTAEGLLPSSKGARVSFDTSNDSTVTHGPFEVSSLIAGFWVFQTKDLQEAIDWARNAPFRDAQAVTEIRQIATAEDFGDQMTKELLEKENELRARVGE